jgi:hypothetical protein
LTTQYKTPGKSICFSRVQFFHMQTVHWNRFTLTRTGISVQSTSGTFWCLTHVLKKYHMDPACPWKAETKAPPSPWGKLLFEWVVTHGGCLHLSVGVS